MLSHSKGAVVQSFLSRMYLMSAGIGSSPPHEPLRISGLENGWMDGWIIIINTFCLDLKQLYQNIHFSVTTLPTCECQSCTSNLCSKLPVPGVFCISAWPAGWDPSQSTPPCRAPPHLSAQMSPSPSFWHSAPHPTQEGLQTSPESLDAQVRQRKKKKKKMGKMQGW